MRRKGPVVNPVTLRDCYVQKGEYSAKLLIDARESPNIDLVKVELRNSDGKPMEFTSKRWGTKINVNFRIDDDTPDGVSIIDIMMDGKSGFMQERFSFWIIK